MSYRSKRTRAHVMTKDDDTVASKKVTSSIDPWYDDIGVDRRWRPFSPSTNTAIHLEATPAHAPAPPQKAELPKTIKSNKLDLPPHARTGSAPICKNSQPKIPQHKMGQQPSDQEVVNPKTQAKLSTFGNTNIPQQKTKRTLIWKHPPTSKNPLVEDRQRLLLKKSSQENKPLTQMTQRNTTPPMLHNNKSPLPTSTECLQKINLGSISSRCEGSMPVSQTPGSVPKDVEAGRKYEKSSVTPIEADFGLQNGEKNESTRLKTFKPIRRNANVWPDHVEFDENEKVMAIDAEGNYQMISGSIQPLDIWHSDDVRYFVSFNEFYQPLKKGGHILVRFIGDVAKTEWFCPIRETNWHHVNTQYKVDIIMLIRARYIIPDGDCYDQGILKRTGKSVRQYRHHLKKTLFKPTIKTKDQNYQAIPKGHPRDSWIHLVDYWYSEKGKKFSDYGKEARLTQIHVHITVSISYVNIRADFEEKNEREPSLLEIFEQTRRKKDESFVKDTMTEDLLVYV
ncbi:hypothetical protein vseg_017727 [Gypsophila vaccaria]